MAWFAVQSLAMMVVAFTAGVVVGWLLRGRRSRLESPATSNDLVGTATSPVPAGAILATDTPSEPAADLGIWTPPPTAPPAVVSAHPDVVAEHPVVDTEHPVVDTVVAAVDTEEPAGDTGVAVVAEPWPRPHQPPVPVESVEQPESVEAGEEHVLLDDLTLIDGVSDRMARALAAEGLGSFFAVANASEDALRRALRVNRIRSAPGISFWAARAAELMAENQADTETDPIETDPIETDPIETDPIETDPIETDVTTSVTDDEEPGAFDEEPGAFDEEASPLAAAMAALEVAQSPATQVAASTIDDQNSDDQNSDDQHSDGREHDASAATTSPLVTPAPRTGSAFRTAAHAPGVPSWTTITPTSSDDLERIIGVTPAIVDTLHDAGVTNYTQLAAVRDEELEQILGDAQIELPRELPTWSVQAALLLQGDAESAATLAGGLMVGRENS